MYPWMNQLNYLRSTWTAHQQLVNNTTFYFSFLKWGWDQHCPLFYFTFFLRRCQNIFPEDEEKCAIFLQILSSDKNDGRRPSTPAVFCSTENRRIFFGGSPTGRKSEKLSLMAVFLYFSFLFWSNDVSNKNILSNNFTIVGCLNESTKEKTERRKTVSLLFGVGFWCGTTPRNIFWADN